MRQLSHFQINENITFQDTMIEDEIDIEILIVVSHQFLTSNEAESATQFKEKLLKVIDECLL